MINLLILFQWSLFFLTMKLSLPWPPPFMFYIKDSQTQFAHIAATTFYCFQFLLFNAVKKSIAWNCFARQNFLPQHSHTQAIFQNINRVVFPLFVLTYCSKKYHYTNIRSSLWAIFFFSIEKINNSIFFGFWTHLRRKICQFKPEKMKK